MGAEYTKNNVMFLVSNSGKIQIKFEIMYFHISKNVLSEKMYRKESTYKSDFVVRDGGGLS